LTLRRENPYHSRVLEASASDASALLPSIGLTSSGPTFMALSRDHLLALWDRATEALATADPDLCAELTAARTDLADRLPRPPRPLPPAKPKVLTPEQQAAVALAGKGSYLHLDVKGKTYWVNISPNGEPYSITVVYGPSYSRSHRLVAGGGRLDQNPSPTVRRVLAAMREKVRESMSAKEGA
jgi:hypothetical protein